MAFVTLEDLYGSMEVIVFPTVLSRYRNLLAGDNTGYRRTDQYKGRRSAQNHMRKRQAAEEKEAQGNGNGDANGENSPSPGTGRQEILYIKSSLPENSSEMRSALSLLKFFSGKIPVVFCHADAVGNISKMDIGEYRVDWCETLRRELAERFGGENVRLVAKDRQKG